MSQAMNAEITEAMIDAGVRALLDWQERGVNRSALVRNIYSEMQALSANTVAPDDAELVTRLEKVAGSLEASTTGDWNLPKGFAPLVAKDIRALLERLVSKPDGRGA